MGLADKVLAKFWGVLQGFVKKYTDFIKKPNALALVGAAANKILDGILDYLKSLIVENLPGLIAAGTDLLLSKIFADPYNPTDDEIAEYVATHPGLKRVMAYAGNDLSESIAGDIVLACTDPEYPDEVFRQNSAFLNIPSEGITGDDFIRAVQLSSDFDDKVSGYGKNLANAAELLKDIKGLLPWVFMVYTIVLKVKEWLAQNENPSKFRGKYISRLIRIATALMKEAAADAKENAGNLSNSTKGLIDSLKSIDTAIAAVTLAYTIYEKNRKDLQDASFDALDESLSSITCTIPKPQRPSAFPLDSSSLNLAEDFSGFSCPISLDDFITPKEPIESKIASFSCPIPVESIYDPQLPPPSLAPLLQTKALYADLSNSSSAFSPRVSRDSLVVPGTPLFLTPKGDVLSSVSGRVLEISHSKREILIEDASPQPLPIEEDIKTLGNLYRDAIDADDAIDKWYIRTLLPSLLSASPLLDPSVASTSGYSVLYLTGGLEKRQEAAQKSAKALKKTYDKDVEEVTGDKKIKKRAENGEDMTSVKLDVDRVKNTYYKGIKAVGERAIYQAQRTIVDKKALEMLDWYILLYEEILSSREDQKDLEYKRNTPMEDQIAAGVVSPYLIALETKVSSIITERLFIDSSTAAGLGSKIGTKTESLCKELDKGSSPKTPYKTYLEWLQGEYDKAISEGKSPEKALNVSSGIISQLGKGNNSLSTEEKNDLKFRIYTLFSFIQNIKYQVSKGYSTTKTVEQVSREEGSWFQNFFSNLWKKRDEIPKVIDELITKLDEETGIYLPELSLTRDGEDLLYFPYSEPSDCPAPEIPEEISPFTSTDWDNKKYWIKYCSMATLASVLTPPWGVGIPPPLNIPLPTVYIPIKALRTGWGITLIGLTVTGIWIFPFVLVVNQDILHHVPFADPATMVKKQADGLKKGLIDQIKTFRNETLKKAYERQEKKVQAAQDVVDELLRAKRELRENKPKRDRAAEALGTAAEKAQAIAAHTSALAKWTESLAVLEERTVEAKGQKYLEEIKAQILAKAMRGQKVQKNPDPTIVAAERAEAAIDKAFSVIDKLLASIDPLLAPLPISAKPEKSYFALSLKNPKPLQEIGTGVPEINEGLVQSLQKPFELIRDDLMSPTLKAKLTSSYLNGKLVAKTLAAQNIAIIPVDPYPPYEKLKIGNVAWTLGYLPEWASTGAGQFGFPGFPKLPI